VRQQDYFRLERQDRDILRCAWQLFTADQRAYEQLIWNCRRGGSPSELPDQYRQAVRLAGLRRCLFGNKDQQRIISCLLNHSGDGDRWRPVFSVDSEPEIFATYYDADQMIIPWWPGDAINADDGPAW
jgi:hypothetical protein